MEKKDTLSRLKAEERRRRRQIIIDAARKVFGEKTYDQVSMAEIARAAGIAKSSIYTYFTSQEALYADIACTDAAAFIGNLSQQIEKAADRPLETCIDSFLTYYTRHTAQWRMITHFALHGNKEMAALAQLNDIGRHLMDVFERVFFKMGCTRDARILAHTLFAGLSGILIAFRNYPGRTENERIDHMTRVGQTLASMARALVVEHAKNSGEN